MQFQPTSEPRLYYASDGAVSNWALLYLLPQGALNPPSSISFANSWTTQGWYLFLEQPLLAGNAAAFAAAAWTLLNNPHLVGTRFVWLNPPEDSAPLTGTNLAVYQPGGGGYATAFEATFA